MGMRSTVLGKVLSIEQKFTSKNQSEFWNLELDISGAKESEFPVKFSCWDKKLYSKLSEINEGSIVILDAVAKSSEYNDKVYVNWDITSIFEYGSKNRQANNSRNDQPGASRSQPPPASKTRPPAQTEFTNNQIEEEDDVPF